MSTCLAKAWFTAFLATIVGLASTPAWAEPVTQPVSISYPDTCTSEFVDLTGTITVDTEITTDANGGVHIAENARVRATGVGRDTGTQYQLN
jgi:hypothetical protein